MGVPLLLGLQTLLWTLAWLLAVDVTTLSVQLGHEKTVGENFNYILCFVFFFNRFETDFQKCTSIFMCWQFYKWISSPRVTLTVLLSLGDISITLLTGPTVVKSTTTQVYCRYILLCFIHSHRKYYKSNKPRYDLETMRRVFSGYPVQCRFTNP